MYHLKTGGKRLRGLLPLYTFFCLGQNPERAIPLGVACELVHNATLIHDDLQDGDEYRRGAPTVWKHFGSAQAINSGDALFQQANLVLLKALKTLPCTASLIVRMVEEASKQVLSVIEGQAQEFLLKDENCPTKDQYYKVISGKTSGLFSLPVSLALLALDADEAVLNHFYSLTNKMGIVFQIQDDLLDLYGTKGRSVRASDIREGKISFLVTDLLEKTQRLKSAYRYWKS